MTYFSTINAYLHQSSLLIQAYPQTTRITTKYSLPRNPPHKTSTTTNATSTNKGTDTPPTTKPKREPREPTATLTLKTYNPESGICLKYRTDKAAEVGRLMTGLGRLAKAEIIELPRGGEEGGAGAGAGAGVIIGGEEALSQGGPAQGDKMDVDGVTTLEGAAKTVLQMTQQGQPSQQQQSSGGGGGGGGKKKKKGKK